MGVLGSILSPWRTLLLPVLFVICLPCLGELPILAKADVGLLVGLRHLLNRCPAMHLHLPIHIIPALLAKRNRAQSTNVSFNPLSLLAS